MAAKFELKKSKNDKFVFNLLAANGQVILTSEMYESRASALNGIESVKKNAVDDGRYERKVQKDGKPFFAYVAHQAPHDPYHLPKDWRSRHVGEYDQGWDAVRQARLSRQGELRQHDLQVFGAGGVAGRHE